MLQRDQPDQGVPAQVLLRVSPAAELVPAGEETLFLTQGRDSLPSGCVLTASGWCGQAACT